MPGAVVAAHHVAVGEQSDGAVGARGVVRGRRAVLCGDFGKPLMSTSSAGTIVPGLPGCPSGEPGGDFLRRVAGGGPAVKGGVPGMVMSGGLPLRCLAGDPGPRGHGPLVLQQVRPEITEVIALRS